ncbi:MULTISPECIES: alkyl hydroperoxide reductase subunit F [Burkholderia]|uniref:Alkyl hydroperoxide reductase subunit F n=6 Tax=Burkholderia gladioli TaxID=28095 RepID=A0A2A7SF85_BURGA|nr:MULTISPECIES: alkyl hydroperoxide reductase subunit F [Burkholderia]MBU9168125.1 alkyl hydroperoxide reductase subunit F [Burkholderia gladioli]MBU9213087.1 alkyl hydroperoxide reductase subunit F [Burkholderia gladioli]MDN7738004.1 alkyl hydroperoxide reductase subunit F [Burkholderia gladioli]MDN7802946.1 alkyl hydroperoxide reductase subunit F [Burkholderia gladioli]MDN8059440.1 alkyl hydroperoxide reductase subunit F [Burkholderia gladioli]
MLDANLKNQLKSYLDKLTRPIELVASLDDGAKSQELIALLKEIGELSPRVSVIERRDDAERKPSFSIGEPGKATGIRFAGIPMGHEFTSLVLALLQVGGHPLKLDEDTIEQIRNLDGDFSFETYFSLSCQNCPEVVQALNVMALLNPRIRHVAIDGALFQNEVEARQIMAVPTMFLNGESFGQGRSSVKEILAKIDTGASARAAKALANKDVFDVLVVGGGPAGAAAAIYAARKGIRTGVVAERFGGQVLDTMAIENFISVQETEGPKFAVALEQHVKQYDVDVMDVQRATALIPGKVNEIHLENGAVLKGKTIVLSTGARWRELNVPGEREYRNKGVAYCPHCDGPLFKGKRVAVVGGGNSGVEAAIDLAGIVREVTLIEFGQTLRADEVLQRKLRSLKNVTVITSAQTTELLGDGQKLGSLVYLERETGETKRIDLEGVFVQIGLVPNTEWLKGTIELSKHGEIVVDARGATSIPGVFAAGDVTTVPYKQIVIAVGEGAKASLSAFDYLIRQDVEVPVAAGEAVTA